jgi:hypothetical protein
LKADPIVPVAALTAFFAVTASRAVAGGANEGRAVKFGADRTDWLPGMIYTYCAAVLSTVCACNKVLSPTSLADRFAMTILEVTC